MVYDLENEIRVEDLTGYSIDGLVESYFLSDKYSDELKGKVARYETLLKQKEYKNGDFEELFKLKIYFDELPTFMAPELSVKLKQLERL